jgi:hypothetical protein
VSEKIISELEGGGGNGGDWLCAAATPMTTSSGAKGIQLT